QSGSATIIYA
ncbi:glycine-zipper containing OmpA-like membrane domain protein, partial [Vibrio parahaemolyticus EKP-028]